MAPRKVSSPASSPPIPIGNCEVIVDAKTYTSQLNHNSLQINLSRNNKITISVIDKKCDTRENESEECGEHNFVLVNPKDSDEETKTLIQEVLNLYKKELPAMNYAANTGKETKFLQKCVSNGKYCTLISKFKSAELHREVIAAMSYQIIPSDTQCAEIPLAAVNSIHQTKGIGRSLYMELKKRLMSVGIRTIYCWGDKESEGFWIKQGFTVIGEVNKKGRAKRLPIKSDIRKSLCFPGGSSLMVSHIIKDTLDHVQDHSNGLIKQPENDINEEVNIVEDSQPEILMTDNSLMDGVGFVKSLDNISMDSTSRFITEVVETNVKECSCSEKGTNKRVWEASYSSMNSKKIKGGHLSNCQFGSGDSDENLSINGNKYIVNSISIDDVSDKMIVEDTGKCYKIMLMNIADDNKKSTLTKIIEDLGGAVTCDGSLSTHVITGKVRKTFNFCKALCSGAWIVTPTWLKQSFREGKFVDEIPFILKDEEYEAKYKIELKDAIFRARENPNGVFRGYDVCIVEHIEPPISNLLDIISSAGGNVISGIEKMKDEMKTIFIAYEEDMEEALLAVKMGVQTFGIDWFMSCIMRQELDLKAPEFALSL